MISTQTLSPKLKSFAAYTLCFFVVASFFFLGQNRMTLIYDEGLMLTAVMRVMAGQVLHRDFYFNYGPGTPYLLAGLFRLFGPSVLVERLLGIFGSTVFVLSVRWMVREIGDERVSWMAACLSVLWIFDEGGAVGFLPVFLLWSTWLIAAAFNRDIRPGRAFVAGVFVGIAALFRYDMGVGLVVCHFVSVALGVKLRTRDILGWGKCLVGNLWAYFAGLTLVAAPLLLAYSRAGSLHDTLFDIVLYTAKYYRVGRGLPFPKPWNLLQLQELVVYLLLILAILSVYVAVQALLEQRRGNNVREFLPNHIGILIVFSLVALMLFAKASVRVGAGGVLPSLQLSTITAAVLYQNRFTYSGILRKSVVFSIVSMFATGMWASLHMISVQHKSRGSMLLWILTPGKMAPDSSHRSWCKENSPVTRGVCFLMENDHIDAAEFLMHHTGPEDTLYLGLPKHDRIFANDNMTYFATQRLPATKWSHFDPFLQNSGVTQREMIAELERNRPPYMALDGEFEDVHEPNGSSTHTGVFLLDDYIAQHYTLAKTFGVITVLKRND